MTVEKRPIAWTAEGEPLYTEREVKEYEADCRDKKLEGTWENYDDDSMGLFKG